MLSNIKKTIATTTLAAATAIAGLGTAQATCNLRPAYGVKSFNHSQSWGNSNFGAGFGAGAGTTTRARIQQEIDTFCAPVHHFPEPMRSLMQDVCDDAYDGLAALPSDYVKAYARADFDANVFGGSIEVAGADGYAESGDGDHDNNISMQLLGLTVFDRKVSVSRNFVIAEQDFIDAEKTYWVGPVPVTVGGTVTGSVELDTELMPGATGATLNVTPSVNLTGSAVAAIGGACARAGINGELNLSSVAAPVDLSLTFGDEIQADLDMSIEYTVADGSINLFAEICVASASWELISWDGYSRDWSLVDKTICI